MTKEEYRKYLNSDHWKKFRKHIYSKIKHCEACESDTNLNIHHLNYTCLYNERKIDVIVLCRICHQSLHNSAKKGFSQKRWIELHTRKKIDIHNKISKIKTKRQISNIEKSIITGKVGNKVLSGEEWLKLISGKIY